MKRILSFICVLIIVISLVACSKGGEQGLSDAVSHTSSYIYDESVSSITNIQSSEPTKDISSEAKAVSSKTPSSKDTDTTSEEVLPKQSSDVSVEESTEMKINVKIGSSTFEATLAENSAVNSFVEMMKSTPVVISMSDYSGFEKVGSLPNSLPTSNSQITTQSGDIVLYNGNQIVIFYGSNSWSYTRLGKIDDLSGWEEALGGGDIQVTFELK